MSIDSFLAHARERRELLMRDACTIVRPGTTAFNPATGDYDEVTPATTVYSGKCQIKQAFSPAEREKVVAERETTFRFYEIVLPLATPVVEINDLVTIDESDDAWAVARPEPFVVGSVEYAGNRTARHITVWDQERTSG